MWVPTANIPAETYNSQKIIAAAYMQLIPWLSWAKAIQLARELPQKKINESKWNKWSYNVGGQAKHKLPKLADCSSSYWAMTVNIYQMKGKSYANSKMNSSFSSQGQVFQLVVSN